MTATMTPLRGRRVAGPPQRRPVPFGRRVLAAGAAFAVAAAAVWGGYALWHRRQVQQQKDSYAAGHRGYLAGDCPAALPALTAAGRDGLDPGTARRARAERDACRDLLAAGATKDPAARLAAYFAYVKVAPEPLKPAAASAAQVLVRQSPTAAATDPKVCGAHADLIEAGFLPPVTAGDAGPQWLAGCLAVVERTKDWFLATRIGEALVREYPKSPQAAAAKTSLVRIEVLKTASLPQTLELDAWKANGRRSGEKVLISYWNDTRFEVRLLLVGPTTVEVRLPGCEDCTAHAGPIGLVCTGPHHDVELVPGRYQVMLDRIQGPDSVGSMRFRSHELHQRCVYDRA